MDGVSDSLSQLLQVKSVDCGWSDCLKSVGCGWSERLSVTVATGEVSWLQMEKAST